MPYHAFFNRLQFQTSSPDRRRRGKRRKKKAEDKNKEEGEDKKEEGEEKKKKKKTVGSVPHACNQCLCCQTDCLLTAVS